MLNKIVLVFKVNSTGELVNMDYLRPPVPMYIGRFSLLPGTREGIEVIVDIANVVDS